MGDRLLVCEGPLDALVVCSKDHGAVAAPSASTWREDFAVAIEKLAPARVSVVGDCDQAGRAFAQRAARSLAEKGLAVEIIDLDPDRDDGYDVGDHLREGRRLP